MYNRYALFFKLKTVLLQTTDEVAYVFIYLKELLVILMI